MLYYYHKSYESLKVTTTLDETSGFIQGSKPRRVPGGVLACSRVPLTSGRGRHCGVFSGSN